MLEGGKLHEGHHWLLEELPREGRFWGRCILCPATNWWPADAYSLAVTQYMQHGVAGRLRHGPSISILNAQRDAAFVDAQYERSLV